MPIIIIIDYYHANNNNNTYDINLLDRSIEESEIKTCLNKLSNNSRGGDGEWINEMLKKGGDMMNALLTKLFNIFWENEMIPDALRTGNIIPLFKNGDRRNP